MQTIPLSLPYFPGAGQMGPLPTEQEQEALRFRFVGKRLHIPSGTQAWARVRSKEHCIGADGWEILRPRCVRVRKLEVRSDMVRFCWRGLLRAHYIEVPFVASVEVLDVPQTEEVVTLVWGRTRRSLLAD